MDKKGFLLEIVNKVKIICRQGKKNSRYTYSSSKKYISIKKSLLPSMTISKEAYYYAENHIWGQDIPGNMYAYSSKQN